MKTPHITALLAALSTLLGCATVPDDAPEVVDRVDVDRYLGTWYEQGSFPMRFQEGCHGTTATYSVLREGVLRVLNECYEDGWGGEKISARGKAFVVDEETNAKLRVQFFWPFRGDYWILDLDEDYQWAIVGSPNRESLWFLTREPVIDEALYEDLVARAERKGFDTSRLQRTEQRPLDERPDAE